MFKNIIIGSLCIIVPLCVEASTPCNDFFLKNNVHNGGVTWGEPFVQYAMAKGRIVRKGVTTFYAPSWEGDGPGGGVITAWGINLNNPFFRHHIVAADRRYWGPGSIVYIKAIKNSKGEIIWPRDGSPGRLMVVCDVGGAIKGPYRFDISVIGQWKYYRKYDSYWKIEIIPIYRTPVKRAWGQGYPQRHIETLTAKIKGELSS